MSLKKKINLVVFLTLLIVLGGAFIFIAQIEGRKLALQMEENAEYLSEAVQANAEQVLDQIQIQKQLIQTAVQKITDNAGVKEIIVYDGFFRIIVSSNPDLIGNTISAEDKVFLLKLNSINPSLTEEKELDNKYLYTRFSAVFLKPPQTAQESVSYISVKGFSESKSPNDLKAAKTALKTIAESLIQNVRSADIVAQNGIGYLQTLTDKIIRLEAVNGVFIFDNDLNILAASKTQSFEADNPRYIQYRKDIVRRKKTEVIYFKTLADDGEVMVRIVPILTSRLSADAKVVEGKKVDGLIEIRMSMSALNQKTAALTKELLNAAAISIFLLSLILLYFLNKEIIIPITSLSEVAKKVAKGDFNQKANVAVKNEIGHFASAFNTMMENIRELDKIKSEFVSIASHQLRTPLSAIKWSLKMLANGDFGPLTGEQKEIVENGYQSNERLISLVHDLLDVSRIEEKRLKYEFSEGNLTEVAKNVFKDFVQTAKLKNIEIVFDTSDKIPLLKFDEQKMRMVFQNLIDNAVKYTPKNGKVIVSFEKIPEGLKFSVKDTGIGIPKDQLDRLFKKFFRARNAIHMTEGTGLGLFIVKSIVEAHGGKIWAESEEEKGTVFYFTIPLSK